MQDDWHETTLGKVVILQRGFDLPTPERVPGDYPVIASTGPVGRHSEAKVRGPGVVTGRSGSIGGSQFIRGDFWPLNTTLWVKNFNGNDPRFCHYFLKSLDLAQFNAGSGVPTLNRNHIHGLPARIPRPCEQRAISHVLGTLDDKIELNHRKNQTLEAIAQALFKSWFVDFDPVRAKMKGREPYLAPEIWDLFPDELDKENKPVGWKEQAIGELCEVAIGGLWGRDRPESHEFEEYYCLRGVDLQHLRELGEAQKVPSRFAKNSLIRKRCVSTNDVLIASSGAGPCGRTLWVGIKGFFNNCKTGKQTIYSNFVKRLHCVSPSIACFLDRHLHEMRVVGEIQKYISGTSVPNLNHKALLEAHQIILPNETLLDAFYEIVLKVQSRLFSRENATLARTRDLLLPKLMSGEIRVPEAERALESVT